MYKCNEPKDGLLANKNPYLKEGENRNVFGDVFVFRLVTEVFDLSGRVKYATNWPKTDESFKRKLFSLMTTL